MSKRAVRWAAAAAVSAGVLAWGSTPTHAAALQSQTATQTVSFDLGDLDNAGTAQLPQFDPSLGTLTSVKLEAHVTMDFAVCITNLSQNAATVNAGDVSGTANLTFAGDLVASTAGSMPVPGTELTANAGTDGCSAWQSAGGDPGAQPAGTNSMLESGSSTDDWASTITDKAALKPYIGTGTVGFDYGASSASNLSQPAEWTLVFLASGTGKVDVTYAYEPGGVGGQAPDGGVDAAGSGLPDTGGPNGWLLALGGGLVVAGGALTVTMRRRPRLA